jgi:hypothetical protein
MALLKPKAFFKEEYKVPTGYDDYLKPSTNDGGVIKFVMLSAPVTGWCYWTDEPKKLIRSSEEFNTTPNIGPGFKKDEAQLPRHFWVFKVWNLVSKRVEICEIATAGIQKDMFNIINAGDFDFEELTSGFTITTEKKAMRTNYKVQGIPVKKAEQDYLQRIDDGEFDKVYTVDLEAQLFTEDNSVESLLKGSSVVPSDASSVGARTDLM